MRKEEKECRKGKVQFEAVRKVQMPPNAKKKKKPSGNREEIWRWKKVE